MDIGGWLRNLGLEQYEAAFRDNEINGKVLPKLTAEDLKDLGVNSSAIVVYCRMPSLPYRRMQIRLLCPSRQSTTLRRTRQSDLMRQHRRLLSVGSSETCARHVQSCRWSKGLRYVHPYLGGAARP